MRATRTSPSQANGKPLLQMGEHAKVIPSPRPSLYKQWHLSEGVFVCAYAVVGGIL
jgi:hypothetical protein